MPWKAIATVIFTVALSLPFLGIWAIASSAGRVQRQARWQVHTVLVQTGIGEVERQVLGLEGAVRGFMLSGDDRYLGRLPTAQADLDLDLANPETGGDSVLGNEEPEMWGLNPFDYLTLEKN